MNPIKKTITLADGREITLETGKLAKQADGAVELRMGNTMLLATIVSAKEACFHLFFSPFKYPDTGLPAPAAQPPDSPASACPGLPVSYYHRNIILQIVIQCQTILRLFFIFFRSFFHRK